MDLLTRGSFSDEKRGQDTRYMKDEKGPLHCNGLEGVVGAEAASTMIYLGDRNTHRRSHGQTLVE